MSSNSKVKTVFITGSSSGIGRATALQFAQTGNKIILTYHKDKKAGEEVAGKCMDLGAADVLLVNLDVTNDNSIKAGVEQIINKFKSIDILINNAGVVVKNYLVEQSLLDIDRQVATNLNGAVKVTRACLPYISYSVVMVGSGAAIRGIRKFSVYSATKFGLRGFAQALAQELPKFKVYTVNPGVTATRMTNFNGLAPDVVADIIFKAATGFYRASSGSDINVWEYRHGRLARYGIIITRWLKKMVKRILYK